VFKALKAEINFNVKLEDKFVKLAWQKKDEGTTVCMQYSLATLDEMLPQHSEKKN
jgi:hypothetical protein